MSKAYRKWNRKGRNHHHFLKNKVYGGDSSRQNLLLIHIERHRAWHDLFKNMSAEEAIRLLQRAIRAKKRQKGANEN